MTKKTTNMNRDTTEHQGYQGSPRNDTVAQTEGKYRLNHLKADGNQSRKGPRTRFSKKADATKETNRRNKANQSGKWVVEVRKAR